MYYIWQVSVNNYNFLNLAPPVCGGGTEKFMIRKAILVPAVLAAILGSCLISSADACTTTIVTKGASADGSTFVTHSTDSFSSDPSIVYVPAKDHPAGAVHLPCEHGADDDRIQP